MNIPELSFTELISPEELAEAVKMRANNELSSTGMKEALFGLYKERLNSILRKLIYEKRNSNRYK